jgi:DNA-binding transcriptional ArsR family regulator
VTDALRVLSLPRRREILRLVWREERSAGEIAGLLPDVTFWAISQHLGVLAGSGLVQRRAVGRRRLYRARRGAVGPLRTWLEAMWGDALYRLRLRAELEEGRRGPRRRGGRR